MEQGTADVGSRGRLTARAPAVSGTATRAHRRRAAHAWRAADHPRARRAGASPQRAGSWRRPAPGPGRAGCRLRRRPACEAADGPPCRATMSRPYASPVSGGPSPDPTRRRVAAARARPCGAPARHPAFGIVWRHGRSHSGPLPPGPLPRATTRRGRTAGPDRRRRAPVGRYSVARRAGAGRATPYRRDALRRIVLETRPAELPAAPWREP